jgi:serine kinase of HPr protein (carbohydrate metabolism regulator)
MTDFPPGSNLHATAIVIGERGILIGGAPGSGKSTLALHLLAASGRDEFAAMVADDQVFIETIGGLLIAHAPASTAGKAELRGVGIVNVPHVASAAIDCVCELVKTEDIVRMPGDESVKYGPIEMPLIRLPQRDCATAGLMLGHFLASASAA